jgi:hypothetical protein
MNDFAVTGRNLGAEDMMSFEHKYAVARKRHGAGDRQADNACFDDGNVEFVAPQPPTQPRRTCSSLWYVTG